MSESEYLQLIKDLHIGFEETATEMEEAGLSRGEFATEFAISVLKNEPWIEVHLKSIGVIDVVGRLADDIYNSE